MPTCWAMVPKTSLLLRGCALAATLTGFVRSIVVTARAADPFLVAFIPSTSLSSAGCLARHLSNRRKAAKRQRKRGAKVGRNRRQVPAGSAAQSVGGSANLF